MVKTITTKISRILDSDWSFARFCGQIIWHNYAELYNWLSGDSDFLHICACFKSLILQSNKLMSIYLFSFMSGHPILIWQLSRFIILLNKWLITKKYIYLLYKVVIQISLYFSELHIKMKYGDMVLDLLSCTQSNRGSCQSEWTTVSSMFSHDLLRRKITGIRGVKHTRNESFPLCQPAKLHRYSKTRLHTLCY